MHDDGSPNTWNVFCPRGCQTTSQKLQGVCGAIQCSIRKGAPFPIQLEWAGPLSTQFSRWGMGWKVLESTTPDAILSFKAPAAPRVSCHGGFPYQAIALALFHGRSRLGNHLASPMRIEQRGERRGERRGGRQVWWQLSADSIPKKRTSFWTENGPRFGPKSDQNLWI